MATKSTKKKDIFKVKGSFDDVISASVSAISPKKPVSKKLAKSLKSKTN